MTVLANQEIGHHRRHARRWDRWIQAAILDGVVGEAVAGPDACSFGAVDADAVPAVTALEPW